jgi:nicotinate-nucleotide--dimethylbenzimidazole phosphoribosyltransferase
MTRYARPEPTIGDTTRAGERAADPAGWALSEQVRQALADVIAARRDIRRFRPDPVPDDIVAAMLEAAHSGPSVGHSQPWRFVVVRDPHTRAAAARIADSHRLRQAKALDPQSGRQLLALQLEGLREAPIGIVVACDRRAPAAGVLGRATMRDADMWSCACAIQNLWLTARAYGVGVGWVTLFEADELAAVVGLPAGVEPLGWLCVGYPDERPPTPNLERHGWSQRQPVEDVVVYERWPGARPPAPPASRLAAVPAEVVVANRDDVDEILAPPGGLGLLDQTLDRVRRHPQAAAAETGTLVLAVGDHPVADLGVSAYRRCVTAEVLAAARAGESVGVRAASAAGLGWTVVDAGASTGDLVHTDALDTAEADRLVEEGRRLGRRLGSHGLVAAGEVGIGNTTVASALAAALLGRRGTDCVGLGAGSDTAIMRRKAEVVDAVIARLDSRDPRRLLAAAGGPEIAVLAGLAVGVAEAGGVLVLDGMATTAAAAIGEGIQPGVVEHLVAGQRSNERGHGLLLDHLGLEPLLDLRLRAGEGVGAVFATRMLLDGLTVRRTAARTC